MKKFLFSAVALCLLVVAACGPKNSNKGGHMVPKENFVDQIDTIPIELYTLTNGRLLAQITNYGARVVTLFTPDRNGVADNVIVGHNNLKDYMVARGERYLGAIAGPVTGPIAGGTFTLDGVTYQTDKNAGSYTFNGGTLGTDKRPWQVVHHTDSTIQMKLRLADGEEGFPGIRHIQVTYAISGSDFFVITRGFAVDKRAPISVAWQPYFNLHGEGVGTVEDLELSVPGGSYLPLDKDGIPTGEVQPVSGTPYNLFTPRAIGDCMKDLNGELNVDWSLNYDPQMPMHDACILKDPVSGRQVTVISNRPGLRVSTATVFDGVITGGNGKPIAKHGAVLVAAQDFPNAVNEPRFPSVIVDPEGYFSSTTLYCFEVND